MRIVDLRQHAIRAEQNLREAVSDCKRAAGFASCNTSSRTRALVRAAHCHRQAAAHLEVACEALRSFAALL